jgi:hypothetical protein
MRAYRPAARRSGQNFAKTRHRSTHNVLIPLSHSPVERRAFFQTPFGERNWGEGSREARSSSRGNLIRPATPATFSLREKGRGARRRWQSPQAAWRGRA